MKSIDICANRQRDAVQEMEETTHAHTHSKCANARRLAARFASVDSTLKLNFHIWNSNLSVIMIMKIVFVYVFRTVGSFLCIQFRHTKFAYDMGHWEFDRLDWDKLTSILLSIPTIANSIYNIYALAHDYRISKKSLWLDVKFWWGIFFQVWFEFAWHFAFAFIDFRFPFKNGISARRTRFDLVIDFRSENI